MTLSNEPGAADFENEINLLKIELDEFDGVEIDAENAPTLRDVMARATALTKRMEVARKATKQPHLDAGRAVDADFKPYAAKVTDIGTAAKVLMRPFLLAEQKRANEEAEKARKAAEAAAAEAAAETECEPDPFLDQIAAHKETQAATPVRVGSASGLARATGLRTYRYAEITDPAALVAHYAGRFAILDAAEKLANEEIRFAKGEAVTIPGVKVITEQRVA